LEGRAPARPQDFGTAIAVPSDFSPNEFGVHEKIHHQPLAEASGMDSFRTQKFSEVFGNILPSQIRPNSGNMIEERRRDQRWEIVRLGGLNFSGFWWAYLCLAF
jgi:hypothetical protein